MPESYPFPTYSGILNPEHYDKIGSAIWLFLWCISSTTNEVEREGVTWGIVLGNKPLKLEELGEPFGVTKRTVQRWLDVLEKHEYLRITRAPYGLILTVRNSKKYQNRVDKNVHSQADVTKVSAPETTDMSTQHDKNVHSNKDITKINNTTTITTNNDPVDEIAERFIDLRTAQEGRPVYPTQKDYQAIAQIVARGIPLPQTIKLLEQCFKDYEERRESSDERIKAFSYCEKYILDHYKKEQAKDDAKKLAKRRIQEHDNAKHGGNTQEAPVKDDSITGGRVGWIRKTQV